MKPFQGGATGGPSSSSSQAEATADSGAAKSLAEAMSQAFGGELRAEGVVTHLAAKSSISTFAARQLLSAG